MDLLVFIQPAACFSARPDVVVISRVLSRKQFVPEYSFSAVCLCVFLRIRCWEMSV